MKSKIRNFTVIGSSIIILFFTCKEKVPEITKTVEIPELGLILNYEGWIYSESVSEEKEKPAIKKNSKKADSKQDLKVLFYLFDSDEYTKPGIRTSINFVSEPIPARYSKATLDDYIASIGALYSNLYKNYEMLSVPQRLTIGKQKAALIEGRFLLENFEQSAEIHNYQLIFLKDGNAYIITGSTPEDEFKSKGPKILSTLKGIRESKSANSPGP
ncbi:hypothetical protein LEP1GSC047_1686 [Leptospira inadai serovar Lyme str. 10]|uniref:Lipoprotein n=2 Tax=Leptospira inadai serovar Lyme TaxID=293084 RepID=V6HGY8_9LEPT|nr:hypothetical protein [Leptospira inadai]EQA35125.1 hypothetical protein LEP1GSC047_1686 [Leptospira inadai serovar Lyme str. 10]PNV76117.1 hypothetical protein BES34_003655 [Leptospira inadai serovar Lyme]